MTIYDIAKEAGVSPATVSRVLTGSAGVSPDKRARVEELIRKYDFRANTLARGLTGSSTKTIGLLSADVQNEYYAALFASCERAAEALDYSVVIMNSFSDMKQEIVVMDKMKEQRVDALVMIGGSVDQEKTPKEFASAARRLARRMPLITVGKIDGVATQRIEIDNELAMGQIFMHLKSMGCRRIAMIGGLPEIGSSVMKRKALEKLSRAAGLEQPEAYLDTWCSYGMEDGFIATVQFLERIRSGNVPLPDAFIAINDMCAVGILNALQKEGIRVPEDAALVSFDNSILSRVVNPQITSVDYDYEHFGKTIIETAIEAINEENEPGKTRLIEPALIIRKSSGYLRSS